MRLSAMFARERNQTRLRCGGRSGAATNIIFRTDRNQRGRDVTPTGSRWSLNSNSEGRASVEAVRGGNSRLGEPEAF